MLLIRAVLDFGSGRKTAIFYKSGSGQNVAGFRFLAGFAKRRIQILQCSIFQLVLKNCAVDVVIFWIHLYTLLRSCHHLKTDEISHYEYPSSLSSFINKSQIRPRLQPDVCHQIQLQPDLKKPESTTVLLFMPVCATKLISSGVFLCNVLSACDMA